MKRILAALALAVSLVAALAQPAEACPVHTLHHQIRRVLQHRHTAFETIEVRGFGYRTYHPAHSYPGEFSRNQFEVRIDNIAACTGSFGDSFDSGQLFLGSPDSAHVVTVTVWRVHLGGSVRQVRNWTIPAHRVTNHHGVNTPINTHCG